MHRSISRIMQLTRPKFVTNPRGSYQFAKNPKLLEPTSRNESKSDNNNNDDAAQSNNLHARFLTPLDNNNNNLS